MKNVAGLLQRGRRAAYSVPAGRSHFKGGPVTAVAANARHMSPRGASSRAASGAAAMQQTAQREYMPQSVVAPSASSSYNQEFNVVNHIPVGPVVKNNTVQAMKAEGLYVWDIEGKQYLDMTSGIGVTSTGHCHPHVVAAVQAQAATMVHAQQSMFLSHHPMNQLVERLLPLTPPEIDSFLFTNSGSEATENAMKTARMVTGRSNVIVLHKGFHGRTFGSMSWSSSKTNYRGGFGAMLPGAFFCPEPTKEALDGIFDHQSAHHETAAIMLEPIQGEGGVIPIPYEFLKYARQVCDEHGIMLIYDEVQCGVARSGHFWGYQSLIPENERCGDCNLAGNAGCAVQPDIIAFAKGIGSGYPIGGVASKQKYFKTMSKNALGGTYNGNVVCCAAANATLDVLFGEDLMGNARRMGDYIHDKIRALNSPLIGDIRYKGLLMGVDIDPQYPVGSIVKKASEEQAMILHTCGKNSVRVIPALTIQEEEADQFVERLGAILKEFELNGPPTTAAATM